MGDEDRDGVAGGVDESSDPDSALVSFNEIGRYAARREGRGRGQRDLDDDEDDDDYDDEAASNFSCDNWINTTREEMLLYEKFGENYDDVIGNMSHAEKVLVVKKK